eukprot:Phypoly_transcript_01001.p1 GENE.Phypoly_transcript_01001~~Phypoly_transcript_01001.p1  ORF type:complete len:708 (-),score=122.75 Phypoly_transcript_01001:98-2221(-)
MMKLATRNLNRISKLRPPGLPGGKHKGGMESSGASPLRKAVLTNMVMAETGSVASFYEDDFDAYADEMEEEDDESRELELYKLYLSEDAELVKGIISAAGGEVHTENGDEELDKNIQFIQTSLQRSEQLTTNMVAILDSFSLRLTSLEATMIPIHRVMQEWKFAHENINRAMQSVAKVIDIFDTALKVEPKINDGARGEYDTYLACIDSLGEAFVFLTNNKNFKSAEKAIVQIKALLKQGLTELENIFRSLIMKHSNPIDPLKLPEVPPDRNRHLELVPINAMDELKKIVKRFSVFNYTNHLKEYKDKRGKFLVNSMRKLNPDKFSKEAAEGKVGYTKGSHKLIELLKVTLRLFQGERDLALELLDAANFDATFADILEQPIELLEETTDTVIKVKRNTETLFGIFVLFDIWGNFNAMLPEFEHVIKVRNGKHNESTAEMVGKLKQVCQKSFVDFEEEVKKDNLKMLPVDGTVHELTSNVVHYLKRLFEYKDTVEALLPRPANSKQSALGEFIINVLTHLRNNLESKAKREKKASLANIFLLNNYHYMLKTIRTSEIISVISTSKFLQEYEQLFDEQMDIYISSWNKAADYVTITVDDKRIQGRAPSTKEKKFIKKKLGEFNAEIEEQFHTQKTFSVPDTDLQNKLRQDAIAKLVPLYSKFLAMYADVPFSKNKGKHLRYSAETLQQMLNKFFEGQAEAKKSSKFKF